MKKQGIENMEWNEKFEERNSYIAKLLDMRYDKPEGFHNFLSEAGYTSIKVIDIPEKNWITAIAHIPKLLP